MVTYLGQRKQTGQMAVAWRLIHQDVQGQSTGHQQVWQTLYFLIFSSLFKPFVDYLTFYNVGPKIT